MPTATGTVPADDRAGRLLWRLLPDYLRQPNHALAALVSAAGRPLSGALEVLDQADPSVSDTAWTQLDLGDGVMITQLEDGSIEISDEAFVDPDHPALGVEVPEGSPYVHLDPFIAHALLIEDTVRRIAEPSTAPWSWLPWLAAITGVGVTGVPPARWRAWLVDPQRRELGTLAAIVQAVSWNTTTGTTPTITRASTWVLDIAVPATSVPDLAALAAGVELVRPAGLQITITTT